MTRTQHPKILILGSGGRLGRLLRAAIALEPPSDCDFVFQSRQGREAGGVLHWSPGEGMNALPRCDVVVALWGRTSGTAHELQENVTLADKSRDVGLHCGARLVMHLSSAAVYGPARAARETTDLAPVNDYGRSKCAMERRVAEFDDQTTTHVCLRLANVVGADSLSPGLLAQDPVTLDQFEDGRGPLRSYIGARDLAAVIAGLAQISPKLVPTVLNVAAPNAVPMDALATAASKQITWRPAPPTAVQHVTLDVTRLGQILPHLTLTSDADTLIFDWRVQESSTKR